MKESSDDGEVRAIQRNDVSIKAWMKIQVMGHVPWVPETLQEVIKHVVEITSGPVWSQICSFQHTNI